MITIHNIVSYPITSIKAGCLPVTNVHKICNITRWLAITIILLLTLSLFFPIWYIRLDAPQYPEGLQMKIWINKLSGDTEYTLDNINLLNHYIGMKEIKPELFPELKWMPYIIVTLIILGFIVVSIGKRQLLVAWVVLLFITSIAGIVDFYLWEYDYGHNLDPNAPIKILDSYQPPLFGKKQLLNMTAYSFPDKGGIMIIIAILLGLAAVFLEMYRDRVSKNKNPKRKLSMKLAIAALLSSYFTSCSVKPQDIHYGQDMCDYCKMSIVDNRYGSEIVSDKGKIYKFDAIECMINFIKENKNTDYKYKLVTYFDDPGKLQDAETAAFLITDKLPSPMRGDINAFANIEKANEYQKKYGGEIYTWKELLNLSFE